MQTVSPGDILHDDQWNLDQTSTFNLRAMGTSAGPIRCGPRTPGQFVLNGNSKSIFRRLVVLKGYSFRAGALNGRRQHRGVLWHPGRGPYIEAHQFGNLSYYSRRCSTPSIMGFALWRPQSSGPRLFQDQTHSGVTVVVWRSDTARLRRETSQRFRRSALTVPIRPIRNGFETIRGRNQRILAEIHSRRSRTICSNPPKAKIQAISNKSAASFSYNTFRDVGRHASRLAMEKTTASRATFSWGRYQQLPGNRFIGDRQRLSTTTSPM